MKDLPTQDQDQKNTSLKENTDNEENNEEKEKEEGINRRRKEGEHTLAHSIIIKHRNK